MIDFFKYEFSTKNSKVIVPIVVTPYGPWSQCKIGKSKMWSVIDSGTTYTSWPKGFLIQRKVLGEYKHLYDSSGISKEVRYVCVSEIEISGYRSFNCICEEEKTDKYTLPPSSTQVNIIYGAPPAHWIPIVGRSVFSDNLTEFDYQRSRMTIYGRKHQSEILKSYPCKIDFISKDKHIHKNVIGVMNSTEKECFVVGSISGMACSFLIDTGDGNDGIGIHPIVRDKIGLNSRSKMFIEKKNGVEVYGPIPWRIGIASGKSYVYVRLGQKIGFRTALVTIGNPLFKNYRVLVDWGKQYVCLSGL
jgi:hypothetical protein